MNKNAIQDLLQKFPLFKNLTDSEMEPVVELSRNGVFHQGAHIFMQGDPLTNVYFIARGKIKVYRTDLQGKEQIINVLQPGEMFPHQGFFRNDNYPANAQVLEETALIYIPIPSFEKFLIQHPETCVKMMKILGDKIVDLQNRLQEQIMNTTYEQIILLLIRLSKSHGKNKVDGTILITTQFTNRDLANMIGSSRETVSRTLTQLKKKGLVNLDEVGNMMINVDALKEELF
ncbi:CRP/FNR family transcriptional regulator [Ureibacillus xyleni]|uniref:CRP/FNR family transcriptional regulator n=1 Tax=Ureibacillus xyleni TaxID=614648 RepID=A0A285RXU6_9BACL|nr:Crp/Fnr family transcriptional regulator [Ureibacillus xyleni]SOB99369.1 CRP/FNR family transcriptional regulator [Ureibacillus xyleni]